MAPDPRTVTGIVQFVWDGDGHVLLTIDPDDPSHQHSFELEGAVLERVGGELSEGNRVQVEYVFVECEVVDPDGGPVECYRAEVRDLRLIPGPQARP